MCSPRFRSSRRATALGGALLLALLAVPHDSVAVAPQGPATPALAEKDPLHDLRLTVRARQAIQQDPALAEVKTINVSVRTNVATLWGSVPSRELSRRAEKCVRQVQGVFDVKNELHVQSPDDPMTTFLRQPPRQPSGSSERLWFMANRPPALLTGRPEDGDQKPTPMPPMESNGVSLLAPVRLNEPAPAQQTANVAPAPAPVPAAPVNELANAIQQVRQAEPRYWNIRAECEGGVVRITGTAARSDDVFDFAHAISRLPGVERVILGEVKTQR